MATERVSAWQRNSSADVRPEIIGWIDFLLRYLHRRYGPDKIRNWQQAKPIILGRIKAYQWVREQISNCYSVSEYNRRILVGLEDLRRHVEREHDCAAECDEVISRAIALKTVLLLLENDRLRQLSPESDTAWKLLFPPDSEFPN